MAIRLFNRKQEMSDPYVILDKLMSEMASDKIYIEYLRLRESVQLKLFFGILAMLFAFGFVIGLISKLTWLEDKIDSDINGASELDKYKTYDWKL